MDSATLLALVGTLCGLAGVVVTIVIYRLSARKPRVAFDAPGNGTLSRCIPALNDGWGIVSITGKLRVSHKPVTIVDAQLVYKMDREHIRPSSKSMGAAFPPLFEFVRVANDERASTISLRRRDFDTIKLVPGDGEKVYRGHFSLGGNFATEYSADFFGGKLSSNNRMFISMLIRFEYEYNGHFYWTPYSKVRIAPFSNMGWTPAGPKYINKEGEILHVEYRSDPHVAQ
jgi:hypothetical protein